MHLFFLFYLIFLFSMDFQKNKEQNGKKKLIPYAISSVDANTLDLAMSSRYSF